MKVLLMSANDMETHDYDNLDSNWETWDETRDEADRCDSCQQLIPDDTLHYISNDNEVRCRDCVEIVSLAEFVAAWRKARACHTNLIAERSVLDGV